MIPNLEISSQTVSSITHDHRKSCSPSSIHTVSSSDSGDCTVRARLTDKRCRNNNRCKESVEEHLVKLGGLGNRVVLCSR